MGYGMQLLFEDLDKDNKQKTVPDEFNLIWFIECQVKWKGTLDREKWK